jgi:hypothetical protein
VKQVIETGHGGGAGNLVICEVNLIHVNEEVLNSEGGIDPNRMNYIARMGQQYWCRVQAANIIQLPSFKMSDNLGLGFDLLPEGIRHSPYLTGNEIAQIATLHTFPTEEEIGAATFQQSPPDFAVFEREAHELAKKELAKGNPMGAFSILMAVEKRRG